MAKTTYNARPVSETSSFTSQVDIIVPFHGQYDFVMQLMNSLFLLTRSNFYNLILVDDCSPNNEFILKIDDNARKNAERLRQQNILKTIRTEEQKGFAGACKIGYESGESPYVCFINSDCRIEDANWLRAMGETLLKLKPQGVRMVSAMMSNPVDGDPAQKGERFVYSDEDIVIKDDSFLNLSCFMCHRELFNKVGGFLKEYPIGGYEDEEFAYRLRHYGFKQAVSRKSYVHHEGSVTIREVMRRDPNKANKVIESNRNLCIEDIKNLNKKFNI